MKRHSKFRKLLISITVLVLLSAVGVFLPSGSAFAATTISDCTQLEALDLGDLTADYILGGDIVCSGEFTPIGATGGEFNGTFDGDNHTISGISITTGSSYLGLFSQLGTNGVISNLTLEGTIDTPNANDVGLVAGLVNGTIENVHVSGTVNAEYFAGGLAGSVEGTISNSSSDVDVSGVYYLGGFSGPLNDADAIITNSTSTGELNGSADGYSGGFTAYIDSGTISNCSSSVNVTFAEGGSADAVGGFTGWANNASIISSHSSGTVIADGEDVGGLVGEFAGGSIEDSYSTSFVNSSGFDTGGLIGQMESGSVTRSYATGDVISDSGEVGGFIGYFIDGNISLSYATGDVTSQNYYNGGFTGLMGPDAVATNTYARGNVYGEDGENGGHTGELTGTVRNSYSTGTVTGGDSVEYAGGFAGYTNNNSDIANSFWDRETSNWNTTVLGDPSVGKSTAEMKDIATFTDLESEGLSEAWDFVGQANDDIGDADVWTFVAGQNDDYPVFSWQTFGGSSDDDRTATITDTPTGKAVVLHWSEGCEIDAFTVKAESVNTTQDIAFEYPNGLANFTFNNCSVPSISVDLYFVGVSNANYVLRKYNPNTNSYSTVSAATLVATTFLDGQAIKATYVIDDNGPLDTNPALGVISDPAGIAQAVIGAPRTGVGGTATDTSSSD